MNTSINFRERMRSDPSNAELSFRSRLYRENIPGWITGEWLCVLQTKPDLLFPNEKIAVYIDGPPHASLNVQKRDETINYYLERIHYKVLRIPYFRWTKTIENQSVVDLKKLLKR